MKKLSNIITKRNILLNFSNSVYLVSYSEKKQMASKYIILRYLKIILVKLPSSYLFDVRFDIL